MGFLKDIKILQTSTSIIKAERKKSQLNLCGLLKVIPKPEKQ